MKASNTHLLCQDAAKFVLFMSHESLKYPTALSRCGQMRSANKSDLINWIEEISNATPTVQAPKVSVAVLEGTALIKLVRPIKNKAFQSYASDEFKSQVAKHQRE